jgi:hypothetical protein
MACLDVQTSWHFRFHKPLLRRMRMAIGIRKPVSGSLCRLSVPLLLGPLFQRIDGPQTTGGTQSYALKQFLRSLFQIPTGDRDDADFTPKEDMPAQTRQLVQDAPRPKAAPASASEAKANPDASGEAAQDKDRIILGGIVADLRRARTAHGRDEILMERGQRVSEILARRPDLQVRWLTALDEINKRHLLAAAE